MKSVRITSLWNQPYYLRKVIAHMQFWGAGSSWVIPRSGRINTAVMFILGLEADYLDVNTHEVLASVKHGDIVIIPQGLCYEFSVRSAETTGNVLTDLPNSNYYWHGIKMEKWEEARIANAVFLGFELSDENDQPFTLNEKITVLRLPQNEELFYRAEQIARLYGSILTVPALVIAHVYEILTLLSKSDFNDHPISRNYLQIEPALRYLDSHPLGKVTIHDLSDACGLSPAGFRRIFREEMGLSPRDYLQDRLLKRSMDLLLVGSMNVAEVAYECGFQDAFYFSRFFKKRTGMPPLQWRRSKQDSTR